MSDGEEFDLVVHSEVQIACEPARVWPYLDEPRKWKSSVVSIERLAGEAGAVGEVLRIGQRPGRETVYVRQRTLNVRAPHYRAQRLDTEDGVSTSGYVIYSLVPRDGGTLVICDLAARVRRLAAGPPGQALDEVARSAREATEAKLDADHRALKSLLEGS